VHTLIAAGEQARVTENVPVKMFIADDQLGLLPLEVGGSAESSLIIRASSMLDTLIALFELVWERAIAIHADGELPVTGEGPSADEAALLSLLAAGLTDTAIAGHLGTTRAPCSAGYANCSTASTLAPGSRPGCRRCAAAGCSQATLTRQASGQRPAAAQLGPES
jgi:hypothetical protein